MKNKNMTIILPIHDVSGEFDKWFEKAILSVSNSTVQPDKLLLVCADNVEVRSRIEKFESPSGFTSSIIYNDGDTTFCGQINYGVSKCETEYFSILEFDDEYSNIWVKNFQDYVPHYGDVDIFLPLVVDVDATGNFLSFTNEALWAMGFSEDVGYLDNSTLLKYQNFQISGMIMKKSAFESMGGMKSSMKLTFNYEFLLRATYNDVVIMSIPKVGYKHTNQRPNSLFWNYKNNGDDIISQDEAKFWIDSAKQEYFFQQDRKIEFDTNKEPVN
tara:strand:+ start:2196 stop:3011 length:816 start_codon:yes stop_codon:yes gene_type:complete